MAMVCPQCKGFSEQSVNCPACGVRLLYQSHTHRDGAMAGGAAWWLHTPFGRVLSGIFLAQGLAYGLHLLCTAGVLATEGAEQTVWSTLYGLVLVQALQALSLLAGGALAGAGQRRAPLLGCVVGLVHGAIFLAVQHYQGQKMVDITLYGQPALYVVFGVIGAVVGASIWRPLPSLAMPDFATEKSIKPPRGQRSLLTALRGPVAWGRVFAGIIVVTAGFIWGPSLLSVVLDASQVRVSDQLQAKLVAWEIIGLATLCGAALAGSTTRNGLKQGLCVGVGTSIVLLGNYLGTKNFPLDQAILTVASIVSLTAAGGWFGSQLLPPVQQLSRSRSIRSAF